MEVLRFTLQHKEGEGTNTNKQSNKGLRLEPYTSKRIFIKVL